MMDPYPSDPPEFFIGSTNSKGFHANGRLLPIPPAIAESVTRIVQGGNFPIFRTFNDVYRDAMVREIRWLESLQPGTWSDRMKFYELSVQLENAEKERVDVTKFLDSLYQEPDRNKGLKMAREALGMLDKKHHAGILRFLDVWER